MSGRVRKSDNLIQKNVKEALLSEEGRLSLSALSKTPGMVDLRETKDRFKVLALACIVIFIR